MSEISSILTRLMNYADMEQYTEEQLQPYCSAALEQIKAALRPDADINSVLAVNAAAAIAHYNFFFSRLTETDKYESFTAGDMTVKRNNEKELQFEQRARDEALAAASAILTDRGFLFRGE